MKRSAVPPAVEYAHSMGPTALERALVAALAPQGIGKLAYGQLAVNGLIGGGVLAATHQAPPTARPFEHLGDLAGISSQLGAMLG